MTMLLNNVSVDTIGEGVNGDGGSKTISIWADSFGGGSVILELSPDGGNTWNTMIYKSSPAVFTANIDLYLLKFSMGYKIRAVLTGSSGAFNVNADIYQ